MAGITLAQAEARLAVWMEADEKIAQGQAYTIGTRSLTRAHAAEVRKNIEFWERKVAELTNTTGGGMRVRYAVPSSD